MIFRLSDLFGLLNCDDDWLTKERQRFTSNQTSLHKRVCQPLREKRLCYKLNIIFFIFKKKKGLLLF